MLKFDLQISAIDFDGDTYLRDLDRAISKLIREAARDWLIAVLDHISGGKHTVGDSFPIQTGEAKGSFIPLGRRLGVPIPITPAPDSRYNNKRLRPNLSGRGADKSSFHVPDSAQGVGKIEDTYEFTFNADVHHFDINELTKKYESSVTSTVAWKSMEAGATAFNSTLDKGMDLMPRVNEYFFWSTEGGIKV